MKGAQGALLSFEGYEVMAVEMEIICQLYLLLGWIHLITDPLVG